MTLKEVVATGKPFKKPAWGKSYYIIKNTDCVFVWADDPTQLVSLNIQEAIDDDWEIKEGV
jgi:hypothetical protein